MSDLSKLNCNGQKTVNCLLHGKNEARSVNEDGHK